jgi:hypothetical protein
MVYLLIFLIIFIIICIYIYCKNIEEKECKKLLEYRKEIEYRNNNNMKLKSINNRQIELEVYDFHKSDKCSRKGGYNHYPDYKYCECGWILK